jgi:hypothetical protein
VLPVDVAVFAALLIAASPAALWETRGHLPPPELVGIPDAPDSLLFVVVARVWVLLLRPVMPIEVGLTFFALASAAAAAAASFLLAHRALWGLGGARWSKPLALAAVLVAVTVLALRSPATMEGGAYWLNGAALIAAAWLVTRWSDRRGHADSTRYLLGAAYLGVIALTSDALWTLPLASAALFAARLAPARFGRWRSPTRAGGGLTLPEANSADPLARRGGPEATPRPAPPRPAA